MSHMGMDVDAVEAAGRKLKDTYAAQILALLQKIDREIQALEAIWDGDDCREFVHTWWPEHRKGLQTAHDGICSLGQSAMRNAAAQRSASSGGGGGGHSSGGHGGGGHH